MENKYHYVFTNFLSCKFDDDFISPKLQWFVVQEKLLVRWKRGDIYIQAFNILMDHVTIWKFYYIKYVNKAYTKWKSIACVCTHWPA